MSTESVMRPRPPFMARRRLIHRSGTFSEVACHDHKSPGLFRLPVLHRGTYPERLTERYADRERVFAARWEEENSPGLTYSVPVLAALLDTRPQNPLSPLHARPRRVGQREARAAATVIQWLGSNVGFAFLESALKEMGYRLDATERQHRPRLPIARRYRYEPKPLASPSL